MLVQAEGKINVPVIALRPTYIIQMKVAFSDVYTYVLI